MNYDFFGLIGGFITLIIITIQDLKTHQISNYMLLLFLFFSLFRLLSCLLLVFINCLYIIITGIICVILWNNGLIKGGDYKILEINTLFLNSLDNFYLINLKIQTSDLNQFYSVLFIILFAHYIFYGNNKKIAFGPLVLFADFIIVMI
jgi:Flp pilus assembly protein protease CpaA